MESVLLKVVELSFAVGVAAYLLNFTTRNVSAKLDTIISLLKENRNV